MSADEFQTRYAAIMASVLESAIAETTKLFETLVDELKAEISRIKKENEDLKTKCSKFESARSRATVDSRGSEPLPGRSDASEKRDTAVQCDLVPFCTMLVEQCQPLRHSSVQNQTQQCGYEGMEYALQEHNYDTLQEENSQMAFVLVKQESVLKQEEVESPVVFGEVLNDKADSPWTSAYGIENERPFMKKVCSTGEIPVPQRHEENQDTTYSGLEGVQNQSSELEHSLVVSLAPIKDGMEEESDVGLKILEIGTHGELITSEKHPLVVAQHQSEVEPLDKVQPLNKAKHLQQPVKEILQSPSSDVPTEQDVKKSPASMEEVEVSSADGTVDITSFESPEARPVQPKESSSIITPSVQESANIALEDVEKSKVDSLAVSVASLSREKVKPSESQQLSMDVEESTIQAPSTKVSSAGETLNNPPVELPQAPSVQPSEQTSVTIQDALLLVEAMNQSIVENTFSSLQREPAPPQTRCAPEVGTLQTVDKVPAEPQILPLPVETHEAVGKLPITELSRTTQSTTEELPALPQTTDTTPTNEAQAHIKVAVLKQQHAVSLSDSATSSVPSSTAATQTRVQSLLQRCPHPPTTLVTPSKRGKAVPHKIIVVPKSVSSLIPHQTATQSSAQPPAAMSTVTAALNSNTLPGCTAASSPLGLRSLSSVLQKKIYVASSKSFPVVTKSTATSADPGTLLHPKITIIIPRQVSAVASRKHQSQTSVLTAKQELAKSAAPVVESQELSVSVDKQSALDEVATIWSQKRDDTLGNLESPKQTASKTNVNTENCCSLNLSVGQVPSSMSPDVPPTFEQKRSAVVRLTRLPLSVSTEESVFVSRLPTNGSPDSQSILKEDTTQETPSSVVISTQPSETPVLSTDICPNSKETSGVPVYTSRMSKEPNAIQERTSLSSENGTTFDESPNSGNVQSSTSSVVSQPVFEKSILDITTTKPSAVSGAEVDPSNLDEKIISIAVQDCSLPNDGPTQEKQSADLIHFTSIASKDTSDPHVQMTKTQFLAQLAVSPVAQYPEQASADDSVDTRASCAETSTSDKKRLQKNSLIAQLRSHLKTHMQVRRTETNPEPCTETEAHTVSPKKPRLENGHSNNINTTSEPIPISPKNTSGEVEDITSLKETTNNPTAISPRRSGLCKVGVKLKRTVNETSSVSSRGSKASSEFIPASPRSPSSGRDGVVSITKKSPAMSRRSFTSVEEISSPKNTKTPSVSPRRTTSTTDGTIPKYTKTGGSPNKTKTTSARPKRTSSSREGASPEKTKSTSVSPRASGLSKNGTAPKMSTNESTSVSRRRCTFTKGVSSTKQIKRESISLSPRRCSTTTDHASTINAKSETSSPNVRWPKLARNGVSPKKTEESTSAKPRLIHDHTGPKKNLRVVNAKTLAKAAKAKTIAKMKNSNQSKLQNRVKTSQLAENHSNCEAVKKCTAKAVWIPPRMPVSKTPPAKGQGSVQVPMKKETTSPTSEDHEVVYPPSVSLHPIPVKAPPIVSPLQPLSVIGRHLLKNQCGECGRVFSSSDALESHVSLHTSRRPFSCKLCGKRFLDSKGLKRHGRVHRNGRIHICQQCGKGFVYRFGLTKHIQMVHSRIKPFVCQICNKGFVIKRDVEAHIRMHTGEKPFHCNLCEKKFARRVELNVHLRWHNGEKRHWCPYCGKGFLDLNNLKRHKYIHTGEKPHSCPHCPKRFTQSGHLKKHVKNVHKIQ